MAKILAAAFLFNLFTPGWSRGLYNGDAECREPDVGYSTAGLNGMGTLTSTWNERCQNGTDQISGLGCTCDDGNLVCNTEEQASTTQSDIGTCKALCICPDLPDTPVSADYKPSEPNAVPISPFDTSQVCTGSSCAVHCSNSCICVGVSIVSFFFYTGSCKAQAKPVFHDGLRRRQGSNGTGTTDPDASPAGGIVKVATESASSLNGGTAQGAGQVAAACNASYVSYACANSPDGIVQEPLTNWLGIIVPDGTTRDNLPAIPQNWLDVHGYKSDPNNVS